MTPLCCPSTGGRPRGGCFGCCQILFEDNFGQSLSVRISADNVESVLKIQQQHFAPGILCSSFDDSKALLLAPSVLVVHQILTDSDPTVFRMNGTQPTIKTFVVIGVAEFKTHHLVVGSGHDQKNLRSIPQCCIEFIFGIGPEDLVKKGTNRLDDGTLWIDKFFVRDGDFRKARRGGSVDLDLAKKHFSRSHPKTAQIIVITGFIKNQHFQRFTVTNFAKIPVGFVFVVPEQVGHLSLDREVINSTEKAANSASTQCYNQTLSFLL